MRDTNRQRTEPEPERPRRTRKERVLHTRISEELSEDIRRMAEDLRVPVSNIVRNVLEEAFSVVETVTENVGDLIGDVVDEAEAAAERIRRRKRGSGRSRQWEWAQAEVEDFERRNPPDEAATAGPASAPERDPEPEVLGWQPMILAREQRCGGCGERLERGVNAYAGVTAGGIGARYLCESCLAAEA